MRLCLFYCGDEDNGKNKTNGANETNGRDVTYKSHEFH